MPIYRRDIYFNMKWKPMFIVANNNLNKLTILNEKYKIVFYLFYLYLHKANQWFEMKFKCIHADISLCIFINIIIKL